MTLILMRISSNPFQVQVCCTQKTISWLTDEERLEIWVETGGLQCIIEFKILKPSQAEIKKDIIVVVVGLYN